MITLALAPRVLSARRLLAAVVLLGLFFAPVIGSAAEGSTAAKSADSTKRLPVSTSFEKVASDEGTPYVLKVKNDSKTSLQVSATVLLSVMSHNRDKAREVPSQTIAAGATASIKELSALDRVILKADGFAPLEIEVKE